MKTSDEHTSDGAYSFSANLDSLGDNATHITKLFLGKSRTANWLPKSDFGLPTPFCPAR
nr:hypothetical protein [uncultured bacterium]